MPRISQSKAPRKAIRNSVNTCPICDCRGGSRIVFRRACTRLLLYFNTNKPHSFFLQNTSCIRKPQVISGGRGGVRTPCTLPLDPPLVTPFWRSAQRSFPPSQKSRRYNRSCVWTDALSSIIFVVALKASGLVWHYTLPLDPPLVTWRSAQRSFAPSQKSRLDNRSCVNRSLIQYDFRGGAKGTRYGVKIGLRRRKSDHVRQFSTSLSAYLANICPFHSPVMVRKHFLSGDLH